MIFAVTLWSPVQGMFDEIEQDIRAQHHVIRSTQYELAEEQHSKLVRDIYSCDDIAPEKIEIKLSHMQRPEHRIRYLVVDFKDPRFRKKRATGKDLSMAGEDLKSLIRSKYKPRVQGYFPDIIIHTCDNEEQTEFVTNLFEELDNAASA